MSKSQTGFGNTAGSLGGLPSSSLKGKLATLEVTLGILYPRNRKKSRKSAMRSIYTKRKSKTCAPKKLPWNRSCK